MSIISSSNNPEITYRAPPPGNDFELNRSRRVNNAPQTMDRQMEMGGEGRVGNRELGGHWD